MDGTQTATIGSWDHGPITYIWPDTGHTLTPLLNSRNYKCPKCGGEYNNPAYEYKDGKFIYLCPFCGEKMVGMQ